MTQRFHSVRPLWRRPRRIGHPARRLYGARVRRRSRVPPLYPSGRSSRWPASSRQQGLHWSSLCPGADRLQRRRLRAAVPHPQLQGRACPATRSASLASAAILRSTRGQLRHQHQLAVLRRRDHHELSQPDGGADDAELRLAPPPAWPSRLPSLAAFAAQRRHDPRQLLGRPDPRHASTCCCRCSIVAALAVRRQGVLQTLAAYVERDHARRRQADHRAGPRRLPGRDQAARHQRRRLLQRQLRAPVREPDRAGQLPGDAARSWRSRRRWPSPSARWSATRGRAGRCSPLWACCSSPASPASTGPRSGAATRLQRAQWRADAGNMEGKEVRFGVGGSALVGRGHDRRLATAAVNAMHDSFTPLGGLMPLLNIAARRSACSAASASGLYGMLAASSILAVFLAGLMVGRTPEYLGKKIEAREVKLAVLALLILPLVILGFGALSAVHACRQLARAALESGPARPLRDALCLQLGHGQQRLGLRRPHRQHALVQRHARPRHAVRPLRLHRPDARHRRLAGRTRRPRPPPPARSRPTGRSSSPCSSASS